MLDTGQGSVNDRSGHKTNQTYISAQTGWHVSISDKPEQRGPRHQESNTLHWKRYSTLLTSNTWTHGDLMCATYIPGTSHTTQLFSGFIGVSVQLHIVNGTKIWTEGEPRPGCNWKIMWTLIIPTFLQWKLRRVDEQHEEARASGALLLSLGILPLRKGHKQEADLLGPNNASRLSNAHAHAQCTCSRTSECLVAPSCSEECLLSLGHCWQRSLQGFTTCFPKERGEREVAWSFESFWLEQLD